MIIIPGLLLAIGLAILANFLSVWVGTEWYGMEKSPVSPIMLAIVLGLLLGNVVSLPKALDPGVRFCVVRVLRLGIVLLGLRLSLAEAGTIGLQALPVVVVSITAALLLVTLIVRWLGLSQRLGTLIAAGTAICGATAIVALSPSIRAREHETSYAVACIALFGLLAMMVYPYLSHFLFAGDPVLAGLFLGTAIHDTSQVAGAGLVFAQLYGSEQALNTAVVTKLVRNLAMLIVIPLLSWMYLRSSPGQQRGGSLWSMVPLFVLVFAGFSILRSIGDMTSPALGFVPDDLWQGLIHWAGLASTACLAVAMAGVGLSTRFSGLKQAGWKPLAVGGVSAVLVGVVSYLMIRWLY